MTKSQMESDRSAIPTKDGEAQPPGGGRGFRQPAIKGSLLRIVKQAGSGCAGPTIDVLLEELIKVRKDLAGRCRMANLEFPLAAKIPLMPEQTFFTRSYF